MRTWIPLITLLCACSNQETWAVDTILLEPVEGSVRSGEQLWRVFPPRWARSLDPTTAVCDSRYTLDLTPLTPCPTCDIAWQVRPALAQTNCTSGSSTFAAMRAIGLQSDGVVWVDTGAGWEVHGQTLPLAMWPLTGTVQVEADFAWRLPDR